MHNQILIIIVQHFDSIVNVVLVVFCSNLCVTETVNSSGPSKVVHISITDITCEKFTSGTSVA